ncbi:calcium/proton exchanger [Terrisporobacter sp.]
MKILKYMLIFIPISFIAKFMNTSGSIMFILSCLSILPLAGLMGEGTEQISFYSGPKIGGFLNGTFGNATELIISFFALKKGLFDVVKSSIAGAVIGNVLLVVGASMLAGGLKYKTQKFNVKVSEVSSTMLLFAVLGLCIPAIFTHTVDDTLLNSKYESLSIFVAIIMFLIYILSLIFSFSTHKDIYSVNNEEDGEVAKWSFTKSILVLVIATVLIAIESEFLVNGIEPITKSLGWSEFFVGIILIPIVGNAAEHSTAIVMARKDKMDVALEIAIGSSLQIILFVAPVLVFLSLLFEPMSIVFNQFELISLIASVLIMNRVSHDGESNYLEGVQLMAVYLIIAACFFIV